LERKRFEGKVVLVTGGTSGIGRAAVAAFAREGARVAMGARREELGREIVQDILDKGGDAMFVPTDIRRPESVHTLFASVFTAVWTAPSTTLG